MTEAEVEVLVEERSPRFVPIEGTPVGGTATPPPEPHNLITQRQLSNGIRVNYRHTDNEPRSCLWVNPAGGRGWARRGKGCGGARGAG